MKIHKEGYNTIILSLIVFIIVNLASVLLLSDLKIVWIPLLVFTLMLFFLIVFFFRIPERKLIKDKNIIYSPADGKIVVIEECIENEYFKDKRLQVSIFMSPLNIHSNCYPVSGKVKYTRYHPGKYLLAYNPKSSELNERSSVVIETDTGQQILVKQIAGAVARRIVSFAQKGLQVEQGGELGFIKFGSRVDVFLPPETKLEVNISQKVKAKKTVLARF